MCNHNVDESMDKLSELFVEMQGDKENKHEFDLVNNVVKYTNQEILI